MTSQVQQNLTYVRYGWSMFQQCFSDNSSSLCWESFYKKDILFCPWQQKCWSTLSLFWLAGPPVWTWDAPSGAVPMSTEPFVHSAKLPPMSVLPYSLWCLWTFSSIDCHGYFPYLSEYLFPQLPGWFHTFLMLERALWKCCSFKNSELGLTTRNSGQWRLSV